MLRASILDEVRRDVSSFSDPSSEVEIGADNSLRWLRSRQQCEAQLVSTAGFPAVRLHGRELSYEAFLASEALADLRDLATSMLSQLPSNAHYLPAPARGRGDADEDDAAEFILKQCTERQSLPLSATRVVFVQGNAGAGKTSCLLAATRQQAERYLRGEATTLLLYLDAQGKGLTQLDDVVARALQDLRAKFTYHSVAALARRHCIVPIVDGFDELIGPSSAREAFANLAQFLAQLDCEGALVASSRTAFVDYKTLHEKAAEIARSQELSYEVFPVEIRPWSEESIIRYCSRRAPDRPAVRTKIESLLRSEAGPLISKPFFLSWICQILIGGGDVDAGQDLVRQIVNASLEREAGKLMDRRGAKLLTPEQHWLLCEDFAEEMRMESAPDLDLDTIRLVAEIKATEWGLDPQSAKTLIDRSIAHSLLAPVLGREADRRGFEHELFRFEFGARRLARALEGEAESDLEDYLCRAELSPDIVSRVRLYGLARGATVKEAIERVCLARRKGRRSAFAASNAGLIVAGLIRDRQDLPPGITISDVVIRGEEFGRCYLPGASINRCQLDHVDLSGAALVDLAVEDSLLIGCRVSPNMNLRGATLSIKSLVGLVVPGLGSEDSELYDPERVAAWLRERGAIVRDCPAPAPESVATKREPSELEQLAERLLRHFRSHYYIAEEDVWVKKHLASSPQWDPLRDLLRKHGLLEERKISKSGPAQKFEALTVPADTILEGRAQASTGGGQASSAFWQELLRAGPK